MGKKNVGPFTVQPMEESSVKVKAEGELGKSHLTREREGK